MQEAAMLWTGGKDSSLALYEARREGYDVRCLVTFAPEQKNFLAHPMEFLKMQAQALELPHHIFYVTEPFEAGYENHLRTLRDMGIGTVITGDIAEVGGAPIQRDGLSVRIDGGADVGVHARGFAAVWAHARTFVAINAHLIAVRIDGRTLVGVDCKRQ